MSGILHHGFDESPEFFDAKKAWPIKGTKDWQGEYASQSPLNQMHLSREGGGAEGRRRALGKDLPLFLATGSLEACPASPLWMLCLSPLLSPCTKLPHHRNQARGTRWLGSPPVIAGGKVCDTCRGVFVAVKEGHPAYHRW